MKLRKTVVVVQGHGDESSRCVLYLRLESLASFDRSKDKNGQTERGDRSLHTAPSSQLHPMVLRLA